MLVLKIRSLVLMEMNCEVQMGLRVLNASVAFPVLLFMSWSVVASLLTLPTVPRYVKNSKPTPILITRL